MTAAMTRAMGTFATTCRIENHLDRTKAADVNLIVDTGSECTWVPKRTLEELGIAREKTMTFVMANGKRLSRGVGFAIIRIGATFTIDEVVFARDGDLALLGARALEGLNLTIDAARKRLIEAGPLLTGPLRDRRR